MQLGVLEQDRAGRGVADDEVDHAGAALVEGAAQLAVGQGERERRTARLVDDTGHAALLAQASCGSVAELFAGLGGERYVCHA